MADEFAKLNLQNQQMEQQLKQNNSVHPVFAPATFHESYPIDCSNPTCDHSDTDWKSIPEECRHKITCVNDHPVGSGCGNFVCCKSVSCDTYVFCGFCRHLDTCVNCPINVEMSEDYSSVNWHLKNVQNGRNVHLDSKNVPNPENIVSVSKSADSDAKMAESVSNSENLTKGKISESVKTLENSSIVNENTVHDCSFENLLENLAKVYDSELKFVRVNNNALAPKRFSSHSADLTTVQSYDISPRSRCLCSTGLKLELPAGTYGRIASKSKLSLHHGIEVGAGVIDRDFRGEVQVLLYNHSDVSVEILSGAPIAQLIIEQILTPSVHEVIDEELTITQRGGHGIETGIFYVCLA